MRAASLVATSWYESSARERLAELLDEGSFREIIPPTERCTSPHLAGFDLPSAFDDGIIIGSGRLDGKRVLVAAQESSFLGGTFGEVHGAKLVGLLRAAAGSSDVSAVLLLLDTGGVRLQEANAGEIAVGQAIVALLETRAAGVPVIALIGGRAGCFGGGGLIAGSCSAVVISEQGRLGVSGPEVIETNRGVEEFDARDRPLVWRITGGRARRLLGIADAYVEDTIDAFRTAANQLIADVPLLDLPTLLVERERLVQRLANFGDCRDAPEISQRLHLAVTVQDVSDAAFEKMVAGLQVPPEGGAVPAAASQPVALSQLLGVAFDWPHQATIDTDGVILGNAHPPSGAPIAIVGLAKGLPLGAAASLRLSAAVQSVMQSAPGQPILVLMDTEGQAMSRGEELLGLSQAIAHLAKTIVLARLSGHRVVALLHGKAVAAAFIALGLVAETVLALPKAEPAVMNLAAIARVTKLPLAQLESMSQTTPVFAPGLAPMLRLGAINEIIGPEINLARRLGEIFAAPSRLVATVELPGFDLARRVQAEASRV
jgi:biotin-independent malonate decarboxylase beta subunit/biotin-independent malonate decarboxylase gamma subunit